MNVRGGGVQAPQAPFAAAGEVRPDPLPLRGGVLCVQWNGSVPLLSVCAGQLVDPVEREWSLAKLGLSIGVVEYLGSVGAHGAHDTALFGGGN